MSEFSFDTSGLVPLREKVPVGVIGLGAFGWEDLNPFQQGYMAAAHRELWGAYAALDDDANDMLVKGFSDWSPEALAMILGDCEAYERGARTVGLWSDDAAQGGHLWAVRQSGLYPEFPPLTVFLNDDGKVCLKPSGSDQ